jgi:hypothetical protein
MNGDRKAKARGKSMLGTALFALGTIGAVVFPVMGYAWVGGVAVAVFLLGVILLYQVGKSLP